MWMAFWGDGWNRDEVVDRLLLAAAAAAFLAALAGALREELQAIVGLIADALRLARR